MIYLTHVFVKKITCWEDKWNVGYHVYHAGHIHCQIGNTIMFFDYIWNYTVLYPLCCITCTVKDKYCKDSPSHWIYFCLHCLLININ